ncbi:MAG: LamG domain-containing protein, partial [Anaerolineae bacterium]
VPRIHSTSAGSPLTGNPAFRAGGPGFTGQLDDVRVFSRSLSADEVRGIYLGHSPVIALTFDDAGLNPGGRAWSDGTMIPDTSGWQNSATAHAGAEANLATVPGKAGAYALQLDGVDDYLDADAVSHILGQAAALSFGGWVYPEPLGSEESRIATFSTVSGDGRNGILYDAAQQRFGYYDDESGAQISQATSAPITWTHAMVTIGADNRAALYIDGVVQAEFTTSVRPTSDGRFSIGQAWDGNTPSGLLRGALDDVCVYPRALTPTEVSALAAGGWQATDHVTTGPDTAGWTYVVPAGLEGHYQIDLRGADGAGNLGLRDGNQWTGSVDTLAPRVELTRRTVTDGYLYTAVAQDFSLVEDGFNSPCGPGSIAERQVYASPWYLARLAQIGTAQQKLFQLTASCVLSQTVAEEATACDAYGHCTTVNQVEAAAIHDVVQPAEAPSSPHVTDMPSADVALSVAPAAPVTLTPITAAQSDAQLDSECALLGVDARVQRQSAANTSLDVLQRFYTAWDADGLRFRWLGANWENDGDLFIYLDVSDAAIPQASGSARVYDPYPATYTNTAIWLPYDRTTGTQMTADFALWIRDSTHAVLMVWDGATGTWEEIPAGPEGPASDGLVYTFQAAAEGDVTTIVLPFAMLGITDPAGASLRVIALASEDDALRLWSTMPPRNSVNSRHVIESTPPGDVHQFALSQAYGWSSLASDICPNGLVGGGPVQLHRADVTFELNADPAGIAYHLLRDNLFNMMDELDQFDAHDWDALQDELCQANPDDPLCDRPIVRDTATQIAQMSLLADGGAVPPPPGFDVMASAAPADDGLSTTVSSPALDGDHAALGDGQPITYVLRYANLGNDPVTGLTLEITTRGPLHI